MSKMPLAMLVVLMLSACDTDEVLEAPSSPSDCDQPGNLIANCGFDVNLDDWQILPGSGVTHSAEDGSSKLGCAQIVSVAGGAEWFASIKQCVTFPSVATYAVGADIRVVTGSPDSCEIFIGGTDSCPGTAGIFLPSTFNPSDSWSQSSPLVTDISVAWDAAVVILQCRGTSAFTVRFDDAFVTEQ